MIAIPDQIARICVCVIAGALAVGCQPQPSSSPLPPTVPAATVLAPASTPSLPAGWTAVDLPDTNVPWGAAGVIADASGFVIYGGIGQLPAAWTSPDGTAWTSVQLPGFNLRPFIAAASESATVLLGIGETDQCAHPSGEFHWRREAGQEAWNAVPFRDLFCAGGFPKIAAGPGGFMVAGTGTGEQPFAWASADGRTWRDASAGLDFDAPPWLVVATDAEFVTIGRGIRTEAWSSADGIAWRSIPAPPVAPAFAPGGGGMEPVALLPTRFGTLAVFQDEEGGLTEGWLRHPDGSWARVEVNDVQRGDFIGGGAVLGGDPVLFVFDNSVGRLLTSSDLEMWSEIPIPRVGSIDGLATFAGRTVLVAGEPDPRKGLGATFVYVSEPAPESSAAAP